MEYLLIEIGLLIFFFLMHRIYKVKLFKNKNKFVKFWLFVFIFGIIWDWFAIVRGHWYYPGSGILGIFIGVIPLEDYLFMVVVPYGLLVAYQILNRKKQIYNS